MMRKSSYLALCAALLLSASCATEPKRPRADGVPSETSREKTSDDLIRLSPRCENLCETIHSCASKSGHEDLSETMCKIALCETGRKCTTKIDSPGRRYRGVFQFSPRSWKGLCGPIFTKKGMSACSTPESMYEVCCATACTGELIAQGGIGNWPHCGKKAME